MSDGLGWTEDPEILAVLADHIWGADHQILTNRKDGGVHQAWVWPLGTFDDDTPEEWHAADADPAWSRVDLAWGRNFGRGCTFLIWEDCSCRAGTLEDAELFVRGLQNDTPRTRRREANRQWSTLITDLQKAAQSQGLSSAQVASLCNRAEAYAADPRWPQLAPLVEAVTSRSTFNQHLIWMGSRKQP